VPAAKPSQRNLKPSLRLYNETRIIDKARLLESVLERAFEGENVDYLMDKIPENVKPPVVTPLCTSNPD